MIPKTIHYCWFGKGKLPSLTLKCIKSWQKYLPDYQIKRWDEECFDIDSAPIYVKEAYTQKRFAFVSDYVRLYALHKEGGIYFDTDVEVKKSMDEFLHHDAFLGFEGDDRISTAVIGCISSQIWVKELLDDYKNKSFVDADGKQDLTTNVQLFTDYLKRKGLLPNGARQDVENIAIYPCDYFSPKSWDNGKYNITSNTYTVHYFAGTWHSIYVRILNKVLPNAIVSKIAGLKEKVMCMFSSKRN